MLAKYDSVECPLGSSTMGHRDAPPASSSAMRLLSKRQLKELILYSPQHVARLEAAGKFPKRVQLGQCRVGWIEQEGLDWLQKRIVERRTPTDAFHCGGGAERPNSAPSRSSRPSNHGDTHGDTVSPCGFIQRS